MVGLRKGWWLAIIPFRNACVVVARGNVTLFRFLGDERSRGVFAVERCFGGVRPEGESVAGCRCLLLSKLVAAPGISVGLGVVGDSAL